MVPQDRRERIMTTHTLQLLGAARRAALSLCLWPLALAHGCVAEPAHAAPARARANVRVVQAERSQRPVLTELVGSVRAVRRSTVAAQISGTVAQIRVGLGSAVRAGEVLVRLSADEVDARLAQARALSALATPERDRASKLLQLGAISTARYDEAVSQWSVAQAREAEATAFADRILVRAPFAGLVSEKRVNVGDSAMPGQALLVLEAPDAFRFEAQLPESLARLGLSIGQTVPLRIDDLDHELTGTVCEIQPAADEATRTRLLKLDLPKHPALRSGQFGRLLLATGASNAVSIPAAALVRHGQLEGVFVVESGTARLRLVRTAREYADRIEIAAGLTGGEALVTSPDTALRDGQPVEVAP